MATSLQIKKELKKLQSDFIISESRLLTLKELIEEIQKIEKSWNQDFSKWDRIDIIKIGKKYLLGNNCEPNDALQGITRNEVSQ